MDSDRAASARAAVEVGLECPDCGEPWLRPTNLPGRYRCVYCLHRFELTSVCPNCGEEIPRDVNSALLIKRLGIQSRPPTDSGSSPAEQGPLPSLREMVSPSVEAGSPRIWSWEDVTSVL